MEKIDINIFSIKNRETKFTILLVDDDELVRKLAERILKKLNYAVFSAENGYTALEIMKNQDYKIDLLLTDMVMPGMNGKELYENVIQIKPNIKVLFMSGYTNKILDDLYIDKNKINFIPKPFSIKKLADKIKKIIQE